ncbi:MAG TPA: endonuclease/exonuclease/phosphatase family protein [Kofleriaceae bacterium]|nr:endonuclease/exonuclease/phosphatase family protein [Kofleriaceae bacterium]
MRVLTLAAGLALGLAAAGCSDARIDPIPAWTPWEAIEGPFRPEVRHAASPAPGRDRMRVLTYNVWRGVDVDALAPYLLAHPELAAADLVLLQESDDYPSEVTSDASRLAAELGMSHVYAPTGEQRRGTRGLAILSRFALREIEVMFLEEAPELELVEPAARAAVAVVIDTPGGPVRVINVHLDVALNITERILQLRPTILEAPDRVVVAGDFNTNDYVWAEATVPLLPLDAVADTSQAVALDGYMRGLGFRTPTAAFGATWRGFPEDQRLDAIFTRGVEVDDGAVERALKLSDHWPVWLDLEVR